MPRKSGDGKGNLSFQDIQVDGVPMFLMILHRGEPPKAVVEGDTVRLGTQTYQFDGTKLVFTK